MSINYLLIILFYSKSWIYKKAYSTFVIVAIALMYCHPVHAQQEMIATEIQLTEDRQGHTLHNTQVFSRDDAWIVYDARNIDTAIGSTASIQMVHVVTKEIKTLYRTYAPNPYGPGVGAATFSPKEDRVIFIHGIPSSTKERPYGVARRTGVSIWINHPFQAQFMDARDIIAPFTPGALRGGTHAHSWSGDGSWISFTYDDYILEQLAKVDARKADLRTVGVMVPGEVLVKRDKHQENTSGTMFSVVVAEVLDHPVWGSDEIDKAFDEGWIGKNGYLNEQGVRQEKAIAFQGNVRTETGESKTEVFVLDLPNDLKRARLNKPLEGTKDTRPNVPTGVIQRRITHSEKGIVGPRHWLRSSPDGSQIAYLSTGANGTSQLFTVSPLGGRPQQVTHHSFPVEGPFNFSPDGKYLAYAADHAIFITDLSKGIPYRLTAQGEANGPIGAPIWSNKGDKIAYNRYVQQGGDQFLQIFLLTIHFSKMEPEG